MPKHKTTKKSASTWNGQTIAPGETKNVKLLVSESYSSMEIRIPVQVRRAERDGPAVFVSGALHGDEINGTGAIRELIHDPDLKLIKGTLVLIPVLNILAFDRHSRYLPDRRDLNRSFPGSKTGSLASRMARRIYDEVIGRCNFGIDLHTAAVRRTNYPNVRADLTNPHVKRLANSFGCEIIMNQKGPRGSIRREATLGGCPTIIMEGGEVWKVEPTIVQSAVRGVKNVLRELEMLDCKIESPDYQVVIEKSTWIRADRGGFLQFHIQPGEIVEKDQPLASNTTLLGMERSVQTAPFDAVVIGMTTLPAIGPGDPVCNLGKLPENISPKQLRRNRRKEDGLEGQLAIDLASNVLVVDRSEK